MYTTSPIESKSCTLSQENKQTVGYEKKKKQTLTHACTYAAEKAVDANGEGHF
jgi:hypothetical protein